MFIIRILFTCIILKCLVVVEACINNSLCKNNSTCMSLKFNVSYCVCKGKFLGKKDEIFDLNFVFFSEGFTGTYCETLLTNPSVCSESPCENGGTCLLDKSEKTKYKCICSPRFSGANCDKGT